MKNKAKRVSLYMLIIYSTFIVGVVTYFVLFLSKSIVFNSDTVDVMMWAKATYESGKIINPDFTYAAMLPFGSSLFMLMFIPIFGISYTSMVLGTLVFVLLLYLALIAFLRTIGFDAKWIFIGIISLSAMMLSSLKLREMFLQHAIYYSLSLLLILVGLTLTLKLIKYLNQEDKNKIIILSVLLGVFMLFTATDGKTIISLVTIPILIALVCSVFFNLKKPIFHKDNHHVFFIGFVIAIATLAGLVLITILASGKTAGYADAYLQLAPFSKSSMWVDNLQSFFTSWYTLFEVTFYDTADIFSLSNISVFIRFIFASLILLAPFATLPFYKKIKDKNLKFSLIVQLAIFAIIAFMWFFGSINAANWRLIPIAGFGTVFLVQVSEFLFRDKLMLRRFSILILACVMVYSIIPVAYLSAYTPDKNPCGKYQSLVDELQKRDVKYGYADFWDANALTILSSNEVIAKNYIFYDEGDDVSLQKYPYQQDYKNIFKGSDDEDKYFIIVPNSKALKFVEYIEDTPVLIVDEFEYKDRNSMVYILDMPLILEERSK